ncbi:hypothetical protein EV359DRAFT_76172 [Lentinula novae-zelandiae]|nr:hypothetical protein EV359DRAFT_76172 [Lentinula novae-zelandiae]
MSALKRKHDTFYYDSPSSKRPMPSNSAQHSPLGTFSNGQTHLPPTPLSNPKVKKEQLSAMQRQPEHTIRKEVEEGEPESQLPASDHEQIRQILQQKYDDLMLAFKKKSFEVKTLEGKVKVTQAQLASSHDQLQLLAESRQDLINDLQLKQKKSLQTEQRLRAEQDQTKNELASVQVERDTAVLERDAAQKETSKVESELWEYQQLFDLHVKLLARAQAQIH